MKVALHELHEEPLQGSRCHGFILITHVKLTKIPHFQTLYGPQILSNNYNIMQNKAVAPIDMASKITRTKADKLHRVSNFLQGCSVGLQ